MPVITVKYAVQTDEVTERRLIASLTECVVEHLAVPPSVVAVILEPVPSHRWGAGGEPLRDRGI